MNVENQPFQYVKMNRINGQEKGEIPITLYILIFKQLANEQL